MKNLHQIPAAIALVTLAVTATARTQDTTFTELLGGQRYPLTLTSNAIPEGYMAVRLKTSEGGFMEMMGSSMGMMFGMMGSMMGGMGEGGEASAGPDMAAFGAMEISWTKGEVVSVHGQPFLVAYKMELEMADMTRMEPGKLDFSTIPLKLSLIRVDSIKSIAPRPDITRTSFVEMLRKKAAPPAAPAAKPNEKS